MFRISSGTTAVRRGARSSPVEAPFLAAACIVEIDAEIGFRAKVHYSSVTLPELHRRWGSGGAHDCRRSVDAFADLVDPRRNRRGAGALKSPCRRPKDERARLAWGGDLRNLWGGGGWR